MSIPLTNHHEYAHDSFIAAKKQLYSDETAYHIPKMAFNEKTEHDSMSLLSQALLVSSGFLHLTATPNDQSGLMAIKSGYLVPRYEDAKQSVPDIKERRVELASENRRWFDLVRLGTATAVITGLCVFFNEAP